jgi:hypothetical protein
LLTAYDTGLRASELVAIEVEHIIEAIDLDARLLSIPRSRGDQGGGGDGISQPTHCSGDRGLAGGDRYQGGGGVSARERATL